MFMENVDVDHYFLKPDRRQFSFSVWIVVDIFNSIESLLRKQEIFFP